MTEQFANFAQSSLSAPITAIQTVITIASAISFPLQGNFRIVVQSFDVTTQMPTSSPEIMIVTSVAGNQFTVQRGAESTKNIAFASGAQVTHIVTAAVMKALQTITGLISAGSNVTITGSGTQASPYVIASTGGGGGSITQSIINTFG